VNEPEFSQPLCTAVQIALADLLESLQIQPSAVVGHSSGEIAAAYCYGALSHESAIKVAYYRGVVAAKLASTQLNQGSMISIALSEKDATAYVEEVCKRTDRLISIGCVNSPKNVTVTGDTEAIDQLRNRMEAEQVFARKLQVGVAYHSHHMFSLEIEYRKSMGKLESRKDYHYRPQMFSSVTGRQATIEEVCAPDYWARNMTGQVKFSEALENLTLFTLAQRKKSGTNKSGKDVFVEVGPHAALQRPVKDTIKEISGAKDIDYDYTLSRDVFSPVSFAGLIGRLRCRGSRVDLVSINSPDNDPQSLETLTNLPSYPFNHSLSYWIESRLSRNLRYREFARHELLGIRELDWNPSQPRWRNVIRLAEHPWITDHQVKTPQIREFG
jgi:acyl transferase domain-containing protein